MSGFLSGILGNMMGGGGASGGSGASGAGNMLSEVFNSAGGVSGIMAKFQQAGMGDKAQSWAGNGGNMPLMAEEVTKVFPPQQIEAWATAHGVPAGAAAGLLAHLLPHAVDSQTPNGQVPDGTDGDEFAGGQPGDAQDSQQQPGPAAGQGFDFGGMVQRLMGSGH